MAEQTELYSAFVGLADTLVADYDVVEFLQGLAEQCVALLDVSHGGVMLAAPGDELRYMASSSEQMRLIELLELQHEQGPCFDAFHSNQLHTSGSVNASNARWPLFGPAASSAGFKSMAGVPMRLRGHVVGALNLFSTKPGGLAPNDQRTAQALADIATIGILQERAVHDAEVVSLQLEFALESRIAIEQAKGIVAERRKVSTDVAFTLLRYYARRHNDKLTDVAKRVIDGSLSDLVLATPAGGMQASE